MEVSEDLLWWRVLEHLLDHLSEISSTASPVTLTRLIVCLLNVLTIAVGSHSVVLIDRASLDESYYLCVLEEQSPAACTTSDDSDCTVASKLLEYRLVDMPVISVHREKSPVSSLPAVCKIIDTVQLIYRKTGSATLCDFLVRGKCQEVVDVTWLHPLVTWLLRQRIFRHCYHELTSTFADVSVGDEVASLCGELEAVTDDIDKFQASLIELQQTPQHQFERTLFVIRHRLHGSDGDLVSIFHDGSESTSSVACQDTTECTGWLYRSTSCDAILTYTKEPLVPVHRLEHTQMLKLT